MCATIAFGMSIDKENVRFVIHLSLIQSLEGYAQKFGRAGKESTSCIFFRFEDRTQHMQMICLLPEDEHRDLKRRSLNEVVKYCIAPRCRKLQLIEYFSEEFEDICGSMCDVCMNPPNLESQNANIQALKVLNCLNNMRIVQHKITSNLLIPVYHSSKRKEVVSKSLHEIPEFGYGKAVFSDFALKEFVHMLIAENVIVEELRGQNEAGSHPYLVCGNKAELLRQGELVIKRYK